MTGSQRSLNLNSIGQALSSLFLIAETIAPTLGRWLVVRVVPTAGVTGALAAAYGTDFAMGGLDRHLGQHSTVGGIDLGLGDSLVFTYTPTDEGVGHPPSKGRGEIPPWVGVGTLSSAIHERGLHSGGISDDPTENPLVESLLGFIGFGRTGLYANGSSSNNSSDPDNIIDTATDWFKKTEEDNAVAWQRAQEAMEDWPEFDSVKWPDFEPAQQPDNTKKYPADPWGDIGGSGDVGEPPPGFERLFPSLEKRKFGNIDIDYPPNRRIDAPKVYDVSGLILPPTVNDGVDPRTGQIVLSKAQLREAEAVLATYLPPPLNVDPVSTQLVVAGGVRSVAYVLSGSRLMLDDAYLAGLEGQVVRP